MMISATYRKALLAVLPAVALCGCEDGPLPGADAGAEQQVGESRIEIAGGSPTAGVLTSRAVSEPSRPGYCKADMLKIWTYRGVKILTVTPKTDDMSFSSETGELAVTHFSGEDYCNKWTSYLFDCKADGSHNTGFAMPALAYTETDKGVFRIDPGAKYSDLKLTLAGNETPELYFGRLHFEAYDNDKVNQVKEADNGIFYIYNAAVKDQSYNNCPVTGKLYRIVSQLNVNISKVNRDVLEKMEMYLSNVPTELPLYGNHGTFYPVATASAHSATGDILVATADDFSNGKASLSTFLLPSAEGRSLKIRLHYKDGAVSDKEGKPVKYKDFDIRPSKSFFLTGNDAEVYWSNAAGNLRHGSDLYVYNGNDYMFYSYANVRVNISGDFDRVFAETAVTDVRIEVCPSFERVHEFPIN